MTHDELRAFLLGRAHAWRERDLDAIMAGYHPDVELIAPTGRCRGTEQLRKNNARYLEEFTDIEIDLTRVVLDADGETGALEWTWSETRISDGKLRSVEDAIVFIIRDNKVVYWHEYFDTAGLQ